MSTEAHPPTALLRVNMVKDTKEVLPFSDVETAPDHGVGKLQHIVLFRFLETVTSEQRRDIDSRFHALKRSLRNGHQYIASIESGVQSSMEGLHRNYEQGYIVTFRSEGDRNFYVGRSNTTNAADYDAAHDEFKRYVAQFIHPDNGCLVFDFKV